MTAANSHQANGFSANAFSQYAPRQPPNLALEDAWAPPPANNNNQREDIPPQGKGVAEPGRMQDLHHNDVAYQGIVDYHPQPPANPAYVFPDVGHAQGNPVQVQVQANAPVNQDHNPFGYVAPHVAPGHVQAAFLHPFVHRIPTPDPLPQAGVENLRELASRYLHHPDAQIRMITMDAGTAGRIKVAAIFEMPAF